MSSLNGIHDWNHWAGIYFFLHLLVLLFSSFMFSAALKDIVIIVRSQHNGYHVKKAKTMRDDLTQQAEAMGEKVWQCSSASRVLACRPRREVLPIMAKTRRLRPKGVPLSGFRVGISLVEVYKRVGKSVILVCEKAQRANRCILLVWKSWKNVLVCDLFILKDSAFTAVKKNARYIKEVPLKVYERGQCRSQTKRPTEAGGSC